MCTITYLPKKEGAFILTHSRDESIKRELSSPPIKRIIDGVKHLFPVDPVGMGTWIGISETGRTAALLNGGNKEHVHQPPYRHSRGLVILDYFQYSGFHEFFNNYNFEGLEPFTLIIIEDGKIFETIVDEDGPRHEELRDDEPFIYCSTSLYTPLSRKVRSKKFHQWINGNPLNNRDTILNFHQKHLFEMEKDKSKVPGNHILKTVSISSVINSGKKLDFDYFDLVNDIHFGNKMEVKEAAVQPLF